jgi:hypothetical protein
MSDEFSRNELPALANNCNVSRRHVEGHMAINISAYGHRPPTLALPGFSSGVGGHPISESHLQPSLDAGLPRLRQIQTIHISRKATSARYSRHVAWSHRLNSRRGEIKCTRPTCSPLPQLL